MSWQARSRKRLGVTVERVRVREAGRRRCHRRRRDQPTAARVGPGTTTVRRTDRWGGRLRARRRAWRSSSRSCSAATHEVRSSLSASLPLFASGRRCATRSCCVSVLLRSGRRVAAVHAVGRAQPRAFGGVVCPASRRAAGAQPDGAVRGQRQRGECQPPGVHEVAGRASERRRGRRRATGPRAESEPHPGPAEAVRGDPGRPGRRAAGGRRRLQKIAPN